MGHKITKGFQVNKGLRQGCGLSLILFKIFLDKSLELGEKRTLRSRSSNSRHDNIRFVSFRASICHSPRPIGYRIYLKNRI